MLTTQLTPRFLLRKLNRQSLIHHIFLLVLSILIYALICVFYSNRLFDYLGNQSVSQIEQALQQTRQKTQSLIEQIHADIPCRDVAENLRKLVFKSDYAKEIGIFHGSPLIYCTSSQGESSVRIYNSVFQRVVASPTHETLTFTKTAITKTHSVIYIYANDDLNGVSMVIPPRYLTRIVTNMIDNHHLPFDIKIYDNPILNKQIDGIIKTLRFKSQVFPLVLEFYLTPKTYVHFLYSEAWILLCVYFIILSVYLYKRKKVIQKQSLESSILHALKDKQFSVHFQPIIQASTQNVIGCEALLRWNHPTQGQISPTIFIPLAERLGFIEQLTDFVIEKAQRLIERNPVLMQGKYVSVNIDRSLMCDVAFTYRMVERVMTNPKFAQHITFEITENGDFADHELTMVERNFQLLSQAGIRLLVDDFGTGYSGLNFVRQFHFDTLKIDRVFVKNLGHEPHLNNLLMSMLQLAQSLDMQVIVEGVETEEQLAILRELGVDYIQGYLYSKPLPVREFVDYLAGNAQECEGQLSLALS
ncbi:EAL domain-containing protein [Vibrio fluvialis]|nr:EAL domain-containing protein [Vibrio fluvialis]